MPNEFSAVYTNIPLHFLYSTAAVLKINVKLGSNLGITM